MAATLIRAFAAGRTTDAVTCYRTTRRRLADDLDIDPGPELRDVHRSVLHGNRVDSVAGRSYRW